MKKLILFFVLILGFVSEIKAQFPASSEIYYYISLSKDSFYTIRFYTNGAGEAWNASEYLTDSNKEVFYPGGSPHFFKKEYRYNSELSNSKYVVYDTSSFREKNYQFIFYLAFSKDKTEMIRWFYAPGLNKIGDRDYYKKVTREELESILKPKFDFLE